MLLPLTGVVLAVHTVLLLLPLLAGTDATGYLSPRNPVPVLLEVALVAAVGLVIGLDHRLRGSAMVRGSAVAVAVVMVLGLVSYAPCEGAPPVGSPPSSGR